MDTVYSIFQFSVLHLFSCLSKGIQPCAHKSVFQVENAIKIVSLECYCTFLFYETQGGLIGREQDYELEAQCFCMLMARICNFLARGCKKMMRNGRQALELEAQVGDCPKDKILFLGKTQCNFWNDGNWSWTHCYNEKSFTSQM